MHGIDWQPGTPESKRAARRALAGVLDDWLAADVAPLSVAAGWPLGVPASLSELWATLISCTVSAAERVARWSEASRCPGVRADAHKALARAAQADIARLAAAVLIELAAHVDRDAVIAQAGEFVNEVDDADDGLTHAADAIAGLLQTRWLCMEEGIRPPAAELERAAVATLAPLLAQHACVLTRHADE